MMKNTIIMRRKIHKTQTIFHPPKLTGRLGTMKVTIGMSRKTHDTMTISHHPNIDLQIRNNKDLHQYKEEDPWYPDHFWSSQYWLAGK
jgi:hypothetical protein